MQEKYLQKKKNILGFVDLEKETDFDWVPCGIRSWGIQKLRIDEWIIEIVKSMYDNAHSKVKITNSYSNPIIISVGVHQGSVLSPLFITVMEALS